MMDSEMDRAADIGTATAVLRYANKRKMGGIAFLEETSARMQEMIDAGDVVSLSVVPRVVRLLEAKAAIDRQAEAIRGVIQELSLVIETVGATEWSRRIIPVLEQEVALLDREEAITLEIRKLLGLAPVRH